MTSNYNEIHIAAKKSRYKEGDVFHAPEFPFNWRIARFDGLVIRRIGFCFGIVLHFDYEEWEKAIPKLPVREEKEKRLQFC